MPYIILGGLVLLVLVTAGRAGRPIRIGRGWRYLSSAAAVAMLVGAVFLAFREAWAGAIVLVALALSLAMSARLEPRQRRPSKARQQEPMSLAEARSILGVDADASRKEIQAAYARLMRLAHPDTGGTTGLAAQLNAARDRLLDK